MLTPESVDMASVKCPFPIHIFMSRCSPCQKLGLAILGNGKEYIMIDKEEICGGDFEEGLC